ncbi:MAG TPA: hypothetical protein VJM08_13665, partial [Anaerolineales bacterium]|nr:hypothetical protein [Anaerolineales bacterium]
MGKQLKDLTFEEWLMYVFDHPVEDHKEAWYWNIDRDWWEEEPADVIEFLTQAFENAETIFQPYSDAQLNQGLWFIASNSCSNHMFALMDASVPWSAQKRCIYSIHQLYEQCFAKRCTPHLSHIDEPGAGPLNSVCYMWWDIIPIYGRPDDPTWKEFDQDILQVMESTLQLDSIACRESALHGLGHWQHHYPARVGEIIDKFSMTHRDLPPKLEAYMINAYTGY